MNNTTKLLTFIFCLIFLGGNGGCLGGKATVVWPPDDETGYAEAGGRKHGPPPHAPAHGYRAKYDYHYYPYSHVYYDTRRGVYFYLRDGKWLAGAELPESIRVRLGEYVSVQLETEKPYEHYAEHLTMYPPGKYKKNEKKEKNKKR